MYSFYAQRQESKRLQRLADSNENTARQRYWGDIPFPSNHRKQPMFRQLDHLLDFLIPTIGLLFCLLILGGVGYAIYDAATAEHYSIRKDQFVCTQKKLVHSGHFQQVGNQMIWIPTVHEECTQWTHKDQQ